MEIHTLNGIFSIFRSKEADAVQPPSVQEPPQLDDNYGGQAPASPLAASTANAASMLLNSKSVSKLDSLWRHHECMHYCGPGVIDKNGDLFTMGKTGPKGDHFICLDSVSGKKKWEFFEPTGTLTGSPVLDEQDNLYQGYKDGTLRMLDKKTGAALSTVKFDNGMVRPFKGNDGHMYVENNQRLYTIDVSTGKKKFYADFSGKGEWPVVGADGTVVVVGGEQTITAIDPKKAMVKWSLSPGQVRCSVAIGPDGTVYAPSTNGNLYALNGDDGSERWKFNAGSCSFTPPAISKDGTVYLGLCCGKIHAIEPAMGKGIWNQPVKGEIRVRPVLDGSGVLGVASGDNILYGFDAATGVELYEQPAASYLHSPPLFGNDGKVYVACNNSTLYGFQGPRDLLKDREERLNASSERPDVSINDGFIAIDGMKLKKCSKA